MAKLKESVMLVSKVATRLQLALNYPKGVEGPSKIHFADGQTHITDSGVLRSCMDNDWRNNGSGVGFVITKSTAECEKMIKAAEDGEPKSDLRGKTKPMARARMGISMPDSEPTGDGG